MIRFRSCSRSFIVCMMCMERRAPRRAVRRTVVVVLFLHPPEPLKLSHSLRLRSLRSVLSYISSNHSRPVQILYPQTPAILCSRRRLVAWPRSGRSRLGTRESDWYPSVWPMVEKRITMRDDHYSRAGVKIIARLSWLISLLACFACLLYRTTTPRHGPIESEPTWDDDGSSIRNRPPAVPQP